MTFKPVGIDENSLFPPRVEQRLEEQFAPMTGMTKSYVGLGNVDNTSDANKPVSTPTQTALGLKAPLISPAFTGNPTGITKGHVGLGNVDNTSDANKPVSTPTQTALGLKATLISPAFTGNPTSSSDFEVLTTGKGFILKSPNGTRYRLVVSDAGALTAVAI